MRTKIIAALLAVLTALGGLNLFQSIRDRIQPADTEMAVEAEVAVSSESRSLRNKTDRRERSSRSKAVVRSVARSGGEVKFDESFRVSDGDDLVVNISHADVSIETGPGSEATVKVSVESRNMSRADERFDAMNWEVYQEGDEVHVRAESPNGNWNVDMSIDVQITIPAEFDVDVETSHGDLDMEDLEGRLHLLTSHGNVELESVTGDLIWVKSSHGDIAATLLRSDQVDIQTSHADIEIIAVYSNEFNATTSHADVEVGHLEGETAVTTSHGDINVSLVGDKAATFNTQHGDVELHIDEDASADLDLRGAEVRIGSSMEIRGNVSDDRVDASINGGGATIKARTTHGSVSVRNR